jgi:hypothetical protein
MSKKTDTIKEAMEVATEILKDTRNTSTDFMEIVVEYVRQVEQVEKDLKTEPKN